MSFPRLGNKGQYPCLGNPAFNTSNPDANLALIYCQFRDNRSLHLTGASRHGSIRVFSEVRLFLPIMQRRRIAIRFHYFLLVFSSWMGGILRDHLVVLCRISPSRLTSRSRNS